MVRGIDKCKDKHLCIVYNHSPSPAALALSGVPGLSSHSCAHCCHLGLPESRTQPAADTRVAAGSHWTAALSGQRCQSWWVQSLERPQLSHHRVLLLPGEAGRASVPFLHALLHDVPQPVFLPWMLALPRSFWTTVGMDAWPPLLLKHPSLVSHCRASCRLLAALSAPPGDPLFRKPELLTSAAIWKIRPVVLSRKSRTVN